MTSLTMLVLLSALLVGGQEQEATVEDIRNNIDQYLDRWVNEYVRYIITDSERDFFSNLATPEDKLVFIESFWRRRDPSRETPENEFREQYFARFLYANQNFGTATPGWKTDRGRIYILLGPPTYIDRNPTGRASMERPSEVWNYMGLNQPDLPSSITINFVDFFGTGDFEIVSNLDAANLRPEGFLPSFSDLDYFGQRRAHPYRYVPGEGLEGEQVAVDEGELVSDRFNFLQDLYAAENPPEAKPKLKTFVDASATFATLPFDMSAQLFPTDGDRCHIPVALSLRYETLAARIDRDGSRNFSVDVYAEIRDAEGEVVGALDRQLNFNLTGEEREALQEESLRYFFSLFASPGTYTLYFVVRDNISDSVGSEERPLVIPAESEGLRASSLVLADEVEQLDYSKFSEESEQASDPFNFGGMRVYPNAAGVFRRGQPLHVYFQVHGLTVSEGKNSLRVEYSFLHQGEPLWKPAGVFLVSNETSRAVTTQFDSEKFPPGRFILQVKIEDLHAGASLVKEVPFFVR